LSTLAACIASYPVPTTTEWSSKIWDALKFEVWNGENEDFIQGSLEVLRATAASLGKSQWTWTSNSTPMTEFVVTAAKECMSRIHDSKNLYLVSSGRILHAIASGAPYAFHLVAKTVLPSMHVIWQDLKLSSEKKMLLTVYNYILDAHLVQPQDGPQRDLLVRSFEGFRDSIVEIYFGAVSNVKQESSSSNLPFGVPAVEGLVLLFQIPSYLSAVEQGMIVQELNTILFSPPQDNAICNAILSSLQKISAMEPETFHEITLTNIIEKLPDEVSRDGEAHKAQLEVILGHLQDLIEIACSQPCQRQLRNGTGISTASSYWHLNFDAMENKLLEKLDVVLQKNGQLEYANMILAAICGGLQFFDTNLNLARVKTPEPSPLDPKIGPYTYIVKALFQKVVQRKDSLNSPYIGIKESFDEKFIQMVGRTSMWALRSDLTTATNNMLLNWNTLHPDEPSVIWTLFTPGPNPESLSTSQQNLEKGPVDKCLANVLSMYLLAGHRYIEPLTVSLCTPSMPVF
jgi:DNA repair/transcription protein MET18/MMS19